MNSGGHAKPRPVCQEQAASIPHSAGRTSWPPAMGRSDSLASTIRRKSEVAPVMAFSNVTTLLSPSSPTSPWTLELQGAPSEPGLSRKPEARARGSLRRPAPQEGTSSLRASDPSGARQPEKLSHPHLEKASSWPHRRDAGRPLEGSGEQVAVSGEGSNKHKGWHRQGLRRPSILPMGPVGEQGAQRRSWQTKLSPALIAASVFCRQGFCGSPCWLLSPAQPTPAQKDALERLSQLNDAPLLLPLNHRLSPNHGVRLLCLFFPGLFWTLPVTFQLPAASVPPAGERHPVQFTVFS